MKYKLQQLFIATAGLLLTLSGCKKEEQDVKYLEVSQSKIETTSEAKEFTVEVKSAVSNWEAMPEAPWLQTYAQNNNLRIVVEANTTVFDRSAKVKVFASGIMREIELSQSGVPVDVSLLPDSLVVDQFGGSFHFYVSANISDWTVSSDADWIQATPNYTKHRVDLSIDETELRIPRNAVISVLRNGEVVASYKVKQEGIATFILPFTRFLSNPQEVQSFEKKRHSHLYKVPDGFVNASTWGYATRSPLFPFVDYTFSNNQYVEAKLYPVADELLGPEYRPKVIEFLESKGFLFDFGLIYVHPDLNIEATIVPAKGTTKAHIYFRYLPEQPEGMPEFSEFPYGFLEVRPGDEEKIREYEAAHGGVFDETKSTANDLYFNAQSPWVYRGYFLKDRQTVQVFDDYRYAFFYHKNTPYLTREFRKLLAQEGFVLVTKIDWINLYKYKNEAKNLLMDVWIRSEMVNGESKRVMRINMHPRHE